MIDGQTTIDDQLGLVACPVCGGTGRVDPRSRKLKDWRRGESKRSGRPAARSTDPETSQAAADSVRRQTDTHRMIQLRFRELAGGGLTDEELAARVEAAGYRISPSGLRSRRSELVDLGVLVDSGRRRRTRAGRATIVWTLA